MIGCSGSALSVSNKILAGTKCLQSLNENEYAIGMVLQTGFRTTKGLLIR